MIGFLGEYEATLDLKGRFLLPAGFKKTAAAGRCYPICTKPGV